MKKILKNKKGFTLIELLAVIVVLAIIMVIATQQVNKTIKKARSNSLFESLESAVKSTKLLIAESEPSGTFQASLRTSMDYSSDDYEIYADKRSDGYLVTIYPKSTGKFYNVDFDLIQKSNKYRYQKNKMICTIVADDGSLIKSTVPCATGDSSIDGVDNDEVWNKTNTTQAQYDTK